MSGIIIIPDTMEQAMKRDLDAIERVKALGDFLAA